MYHMTKADQAVEGSIILVGAPPRRALSHSGCDLKALQMNMQLILIRWLKLYKFKLGHNAAQATKYICCAKVADAVD